MTANLTLRRLTLQMAMSTCHRKLMKTQERQEPARLVAADVENQFIVRVM